MTGPPMKLALSIQPGAIVGFDGFWRTVKSASLVSAAGGGLLAVLVWEEGGSARIPVGEYLMVRLADDEALFTQPRP